MYELYYIIPFVLTIVGLFGISISRKNLILLIISLELLLLSVIYHFILIGWGLYGDLNILVLSIYLLTIGAAESSIGLAFFISYNKYYK